MLSFALRSMLGGFALDRLGMDVFSGLALLYLLTPPLLWPRQLYRHERLATGAGVIPWSRYLRLLRLPQLWRFAPAWLALNTVLGLWLSQSAFQLAGSVVPGQALVGRFSERQVSLTFAGYGIVILIGLLLWTRLLPGKRKTDVMLVALAGMVSASLAVLVLNSPALTSAQRPIVLGWLIASVIVETGFTPAVLVFLGDISDLGAWGRGALMGLHNVLLNAGQLLGAWLGAVAAGWAAINGLSWATIGLCALSMGFVLPCATQSDLHQLGRDFAERKLGEIKSYEQPFTRSQSGIVIPPGVTQVRVRAHDLVDGYSGREVLVDLTVSSGPDFEVER